MFSGQKITERFLVGAREIISEIVIKNYWGTTIFLIKSPNTRKIRHVTRIEYHKPLILCSP